MPRWRVSPWKSSHANHGLLRVTTTSSKSLLQVENGRTSLNHSVGSISHQFSLGPWPYTTALTHSFSCWNPSR